MNCKLKPCRLPVCEGRFYFHTEQTLGRVTHSFQYLLLELKVFFSWIKGTRKEKTAVGGRKAAAFPIPLT